MIIGLTDRIHGCEKGSIVHWEYINPEGNMGRGQLVQNCIYNDLFDDVLRPWAEAGCPALTAEEQDGMWEVLHSDCVQYCYDVGESLGGKEYDTMEECLADFLRDDGDLIAIGCTEDSLRAIAKFFMGED